MKAIGLSKKGIKEFNEDCYVIDNKCFYNEQTEVDNLNSIFVFDGVSNSEDGKSASLLAAEIISKEYKKLIFGSDLEIKQFLTSLNDLISNQSNGATTIAGFVLSESNMKVINMGDSKVYRIREGMIKKLTIDDTYYEYLKSIKSENFEEYKNSHIITSCLGMKSGFDIDNIHLKEIDFGIMEKDIFIVCTDGVSDLIKEEELLSILSASDKLSIKVNNIEQLIIDRGMHDNYTFVILEV